MTNAVDVLLTAATKLKRIDHALQSAVVLLDSIAADIHTTTQQLQTLCENQTGTRNEVAELKAMIRQQHAASQLQAATTDRLVRIVETLIQQQVTQPSFNRTEARRKSLESWAERKERLDSND